jgi:integrase/recombinase XerC
LEAAGRSPLTIASYRQTLASLQRYLGRVNVRRVKAEQLRGYLSSLHQLKPGTIRTYLCIVSCFFGWLVEEDVIKENPMAHVRRPRKPQQWRPVFSTDELVAILHAAEDTDNPTRNKAIVYLLLDCGLRLSELSGLKPSDYDARSSTLRVNGKGAKVRVVGLGKHSQEALEEHLAQTNGSLWGLQRAGVKALIYRLGHKAGVGAHPHKFRHSFANRFLDAGGSIDELQTLLGHSSIATTMIYASAGQQARALRSHAEHSPGDRLIPS